MKVDKYFIGLLISIIFSAGVVIAKVDAQAARIERIERILDAQFPKFSKTTGVIR